MRYSMDSKTVVDQNGNKSTISWVDKLQRIWLENHGISFKGNGDEEYVSKIPYGNEVIGIRCNKGEEGKLLNVAFMTWGPPKSSFKGKELELYEEEEAHFESFELHRRKCN